MKSRISDREGIGDQQHHRREAQQRHRSIATAQRLDAGGHDCHESGSRDARFVIDHGEVGEGQEGGAHGGRPPRTPEGPQQDRRTEREYGKVESRDRHEMRQSAPREMVARFGIIVRTATEQHRHGQGWPWIGRPARGSFGRLLEDPLDTGPEGRSSVCDPSECLTSGRLRPSDGVRPSHNRCHDAVGPPAARPRIIRPRSRSRISGTSGLKQPTAHLDFITDPELGHIPGDRDADPSPNRWRPASRALADQDLVDFKPRRTIALEFMTKPVRTHRCRLRDGDDPTFHPDRATVLRHQEIHPTPVQMSRGDATL